MGDTGIPATDQAAITSTTAELLDAVNASDVSRILAVWEEEGVLMPPHHPSVHGRVALEAYFRFTFTSSTIQLAGDTGFEGVTYTATVWPAGGRSPIQDRGKGSPRVPAAGGWLVEAGPRHLEQRSSGRATSLTSTRRVATKGCALPSRGATYYHGVDFVVPQGEWQWRGSRNLPRRPLSA